MPNELWGSKHYCENCGTRFYDLQRFPVICPNCGDHLEVFFKDTPNSIADEKDLSTIELKLGTEEDSLKSDSEDDLEDDVDDILDNDEDTVSLDEIKNITTENTD